MLVNGLERRRTNMSLLRKPEELKHLPEREQEIVKLRILLSFADPVTSKSGEQLRTLMMVQHGLVFDDIEEHCELAEEMIADGLRDDGPADMALYALSLERQLYELLWH